MINSWIIILFSHKLPLVKVISFDHTTKSYLTKAHMPLEGNPLGNIMGFIIELRDSNGGRILTIGL